MQRAEDIMRRTVTVTMIALSTYAGASAAVQLSDRERERLLAHMDMTANWLIDEVSGLSAAQAQFRPGPGRWSIGEVLEHLVVVAPIYWQDLQSALAKPRNRHNSMTDADVLWYGIDRTHREQAIPSERPPEAARDIRTLLDVYRQHHDRLLQYVKTTRDDLRSHIVERQGCDAYQWALLISTHEQRHILQIREIKAHPKFPNRPEH
jgi:hypothetical protein